jgi:hypothetical protein
MVCPKGQFVDLYCFFYINDLPQLVKSKALPILFADDTSFIISNSISMKMDQDVKVVLEIVQKWFTINRMLLNYNKTNFLQFSSDFSYRTLDGIESDDYKINFNSIKFLGIIIESSLTWIEHIDYINSKSNSLGYMIRSLRPVLGLKTIKQIYFSYVHSVLN